MSPHSMVLCMVGTGMLWVGWYGFNAGSAVAADVVASNAFMTTTLATAVASFVWPLAEWITKGKPSVLGFCSGAVAGLVVITPACGFVTSSGRSSSGSWRAWWPWFFCAKVKAMFGYDGRAGHVRGACGGGDDGALLTGILARNSANSNLATNLKDYVKDTAMQPLVFEQIKAILLTLVVGGGRHRDNRVHRQGDGGPAAFRGRGEQPVWTCQNTAEEAITPAASYDLAPIPAGAQTVALLSSEGRRPTVALTMKRDYHGADHRQHQGQQDRFDLLEHQRLHAVSFT